MGLNSKDTHGYALSENEILSLKEINGMGKSEALKSSNNINVIIEGCQIYAGNEDCLDIVRGNVKVVNTKFHPHETQQTVTVKGSALVYFRNCSIMGEPKGFDFSIGDFTIYDAIQDRPKTRVIIQNCKAFDSKGKQRKVKVKLLHGECEIYNTKCKFVKFPDFLVKIYFWVMKQLISKQRKSEAVRNLEISPDKY